MLTRLIFPATVPVRLILTGLLIWPSCFCLAFAPFLFPGVRSLDTAARICIFIVLVASYDLLLGYPGSSVSPTPCSLARRLWCGAGFGSHGTWL
jgi:branched-chain amino acid transport system permease protein